MSKAILRVILALLIGLISISSLAPTRASISPPSKNHLIAILSDRSLWGKDAVALLQRLPSWKQIDEGRIQVFSDRALGATQFPSEADARKSSTRLATALGGANPQMSSAAGQALSVAYGRNNMALRAGVIAFNPEDEAAHVVISGTTAQFIAPDLTMGKVRQRLGEPDSITRKAVNTLITDKRPTGLTLYSYAGGAIVFAESNRSPVRGMVNRVIIDVSLVSTALFQGAK